MRGARRANYQDFTKTVTKQWFGDGHTEENHLLTVDGVATVENSSTVTPGKGLKLEYDKILH